MSQIGMPNNTNIVQSSEQFTGKIDLNNFKLNSETNQIEIRSSLSKVIHNIKDFFRSNETIQNRNAYLVGAMKKFVTKEKDTGLSALGLTSHMNTVQDSLKYTPAQRANVTEGKALLEKAQNILDNINRQFALKTTLSVIQSKTKDDNLFNKMQNWLTEDFGKKPECSNFIKNSIIEVYESSTPTKIEEQFYLDMVRNGINSLNGQSVPSNQTNEQSLALFKGKVPDSVLPFVLLCCSQTFTAPLTGLAVNSDNRPSQSQKRKEDITLSKDISTTLPSANDFNTLEVYPMGNSDAKLNVDMNDKGITIHYTTSYKLHETTANNNALNLCDKKAEITLHVPYPIELNDKGRPNFEMTHFSFK